MIPLGSMIIKNSSGFRQIVTWPQRRPPRFNPDHAWTLTMNANNLGGGAGFIDFNWVLKSGHNVDYQSAVFPYPWAVRLEQACNPPFIDPVDGLFGGELFNARVLPVYGPWLRFGGP